MKVKKVAPGHYETKINGLTHQILKSENGKSWSVVCETWGHPEYYRDTFNTKSEAIESLKENGVSK